MFVQNGRATAATSTGNVIAAVILASFTYNKGTVPPGLNCPAPVPIAKVPRTVAPMPPLHGTGLAHGDGPHHHLLAQKQYDHRHSSQ
ncbi:MAG: hypothetical protein R3B47_15075 [Bacteroidia bacterium]